MTSTTSPNVFTYFARQITEARMARDWTQQQLADAASMPRSVVARLESGATSASFLTLQRLTDALGQSLTIQPTVAYSRAPRVSHRDLRQIHRVGLFRQMYRDKHGIDPSVAEILTEIPWPDISEPEAWLRQFALIADVTSEAEVDE